MKTKPPIIIVILCGALALHAQEAGQVPYAVIHKAVTRAQQVKHPKLRAVVSVEPKAKSAQANDVTMVIQAKSGPIKVGIGEGGEIRDFPLTPELLKENPPVSSNQPKGTSQMRVAMEAVLPDTTAYAYRDLADLLDAANAELKKQAGMLSMVMPGAKALLFHFKGAGKQRVTIEGKESQVLTAEADRTVRLVIDKALVAQNPQVVLSEKPAKVTID